MERISTHQFMSLTILLLIGTNFVALSFLTSRAGRDAWMVVLPGLIWTIPMGAMVLSMITKYPGKNWLEISEKVLGKWAGKGLGIIYIGLMTIFGCILNGWVVDIFTLTILPKASRSLLLFIGSFYLIYLYYSGIEVFARFAEFIFPIIVLSFLFTAVFIYPRFEQGEIYPILGNGIKPVLQGSINMMPVPAEYLLFLLGLLPFLPSAGEQIKELKKGLRRAVFVAIGLETLIVLCEVLTLGPMERARMNYALLVLGKMIEISKAIAGVESILLIVWMGSLIIKVVSFFFAGMWGLKTVFGIKNEKWSLVLVVFYFVIPFIFVTGVNVIPALSLGITYILWPFSLSWILLIWGVDTWKRRPKRL